LSRFSHSSGLPPAQCMLVGVFVSDSGFVIGCCDCTFRVLSHLACFAFPLFFFLFSPFRVGVCVCGRFPVLLLLSMSRRSHPALFFWHPIDLFMATCICVHCFLNSLSCPRSVHPPIMSLAGHGGQSVMLTVIDLLQKLSHKYGCDYTEYLPILTEVGVSTVAELAEWSVEELVADTKGRIPFGKAKLICPMAKDSMLPQPQPQQPQPQPPPLPPPQPQSSYDAMGALRKIMDRVGMSRWVGGRTALFFLFNPPKLKSSVFLFTLCVVMPSETAPRPEAPILNSHLGADLELIGQLPHMCQALGLPPDVKGNYRLRPLLDKAAHNGLVVFHGYGAAMRVGLSPTLFPSPPVPPPDLQAPPPVPPPPPVRAPPPLPASALVSTTATPSATTPSNQPPPLPPSSTPLSSVNAARMHACTPSTPDVYRSLQDSNLAPLQRFGSHTPTTSTPASAAATLASTPSTPGVLPPLQRHESRQSRISTTPASSVSTLASTPSTPGVNHLQLQRQESRQSRTSNTTTPASAAATPSGPAALSVNTYFGENSSRNAQRTSAAARQRSPPGQSPHGFMVPSSPSSSLSCAKCRKPFSPSWAPLQPHFCFCPTCAKPCPQFNDGGCRFGSACKYAHVSSTTSVAASVPPPLPPSPITVTSAATTNMLKPPPFPNIGDCKVETYVDRTCVKVKSHLTFDRSLTAWALLSFCVSLSVFTISDQASPAKPPSIFFPLSFATSDAVAPATVNVTSTTGSVMASQVAPSPVKHSEARSKSPPSADQRSVTNAVQMHPAASSRANDAEASTSSLVPTLQSLSLIDIEASAHALAPLAVCDNYHPFLKRCCEQYYDSALGCAPWADVRPEFQERAAELAQFLGLPSDPVPEPIDLLRKCAASKFLSVKTAVRDSKAPKLVGVVFGDSFFYPALRQYFMQNGDPQRGGSVLFSRMGIWMDKIENFKGSLAVFLGGKSGDKVTEIVRLAKIRGWMEQGTQSDELRPGHARCYWLGDFRADFRPQPALPVEVDRPLLAPAATATTVSFPAAPTDMITCGRPGCGEAFSPYLTAQPNYQRCKKCVVSCKNFVSPHGCPKDDACEFAHVMVCAHCRDLFVPYLPHQLDYRRCKKCAVQCMNFASLHGCRNGNACTHAHITSIFSATFIQAPSTGKRCAHCRDMFVPFLPDQLDYSRCKECAVPCRHFSSTIGCRLGNSCPFAHVRSPFFATFDQAVVEGSRLDSVASSSSSSSSSSTAASAAAAAAAAAVAVAVAGSGRIEPVGDGVVDETRPAAGSAAGTFVVEDEVLLCVRCSKEFKPYLPSQRHIRRCPSCCEPCRQFVSSTCQRKFCGFPHLTEAQLAELRSAQGIPADQKVEVDKSFLFPDACAVCVNVDKGVVRVLLLQPVDKARDEWTVPKGHMTHESKRRYQRADPTDRRQILLTELKHGVFAQTGRRIDDSDIIPGFDRSITFTAPVTVHSPTGQRTQHYFLVAWPNDWRLRVKVNRDIHRSNFQWCIIDEIRARIPVRRLDMTRERRRWPMRILTHACVLTVVSASACV
jgi:hypothetical protein